MSSFRRPALTALAFAAALLAGSAEGLFGRGAAELVAEGNAALASGRPAVAAARYEKAKAMAPHSAVPLFNLGVALFRQRNYQAALAAFQSIKDSPPGLAPEVHFNQGNALARLGKDAEESNPKAALDFYRQGIAAYKRALALDPRYLEAASNIEVVRNWISALLDKMQPASGQAAAEGQPRSGSASPPAPGNRQDEEDSSSQQPPETPDTSAAADQGPNSPLQDTAQAILQEERARREAEAQTGGAYSDDNPSW